MVLRLAQVIHKLMKQLECHMQQPTLHRQGQFWWQRGFGSFLHYSKAGRTQALDTHARRFN